MAEITLQRRALQRVSSASALTKAKKMASYLAEKFVDGNGKTTPEGYQQMIDLFEQFQFSDDDKEALEAKTLVQKYTNDLNSALKKSNKAKQSIGDMQLNEKNAYYTPATGGKAAFIALNDIAGLVSFQRQTLNENLFELQEAIQDAEANNDDTAGLEKELSEQYRRYVDIARLEEDISNGDGSSFREFGVYVDSDENGIDGVFIAKNNDLPYGVSKEKYASLEETATVQGVEGIGLPVYGEYYVDPIDNRKRVNIGNRQWELPAGVAGNLRYNRKSDPNYVSNAKKGTFNLSDFSIKSNPLGNKDSYFVGITGKNDDGSLKRTLFKSPDGQQVFSVDDETRKLLETDPLEADRIKRAYNRNEIDSVYLRQNVLPNVQPFKYEKLSTPTTTPGLQGFQSVGGVNFSPRAGMLPTDFLQGTSSAGFLQPTASAGFLQPTAQSTPATFFSERVNRQNKPETEKGQPGFLKKAASFFSGIFK